jgi:three-Cys-motif partner protein
LDDFEWLRDKVERLAGINQQIQELCDKGRHKTYEKGLWAFWKLLIHAYYVDIFTNVAKKNRDNVVYIDLLAGPGFNRLEDLNLTIAGSPLIAKLAPRITKGGKSKSFDKMILVDNATSNCRSLERIIDATILCDDCNSEEVHSEIQRSMQPRSSLYLAFVDPEGTEVHWNTMKKLFRLPGDLIINYPWSGVARLVGGFQGPSGKSKKRMGERLDRFFGDSGWRDASKDSLADWLYRYYLDRLRRCRNEIVEFCISMVGGAQYRILIANKRTRRGSPWLEAVRELRDRLSEITDEQLERLVAVYKGYQKTLLDY